MTRYATVFAVFALAALPRSGAAQPIPHVDVAVSDGFINSHAYGNDYHEGWVISGAFYPRTWWGVAADIGAGYSGFDVPDAPPLRASIYNFMAGPRAILTSVPHVRPFAQAVFGGVRVGNNYGGYIARFAWQAGGGVDLPVRDHLAIRLQSDWRFVPLPSPPPGAKLEQLRLAGGIAFR